MNFSFFRVLVLLFAVIVQTGCATEKKTYDDTTLDPASSSEDDSHGWGTSLQGGGH